MTTLWTTGYIISGCFTILGIILVMYAAYIDWINHKHQATNSDELVKAVHEAMVNAKHDGEKFRQARAAIAEVLAQQRRKK